MVPATHLYLIAWLQWHSPFLPLPDSDDDSDNEGECIYETTDQFCPGTYHTKFSPTVMPAFTCSIISDEYFHTLQQPKC